MTGRGRGIKIQPFKFATPGGKILDHSWELLQVAIRRIFTRNSSELSFEELYRNGYNMVIHKQGERLYKGTSDELDAYLKTRRPEILDAPHHDALLTVIGVWNDFDPALKLIRDILMYLDKQHIPNIPGHLHLYDLGVKKFMQEIIMHPDVRDRIAPVVLSMIEKDRNGDAIDRNLLKDYCNMLLNLSSDRKVYVDEFETAFLLESDSFYEKESASLLQSCSCYDYLQKCCSRLAEEKERAYRVLDMKTEPLIRKVVYNRMIKDQLEKLVDMENSGLLAMIRDQRFEDMNRMYTLFEPIAEGLQVISQTLCANTRNEGKAIVEDPENVKDPVQFIQRIQELRSKYDTIVVKAFCNSRYFSTEINKAFEWFMNSATQKTPEFLSLFVDEEFKKQKSSENELEQTLDSAISLFRMLAEKDIFLKYYMNHMSKRLLNTKSYAEDAERLMIAKLKAECGHQFTTKLESMLNDVRVSQEITSAFKESIRPDSKEEQILLDLSLTVLTTGCWPSEPIATCILPPEMDRCLSSFRNFYLQRHNGRKLTLLPNKGTGDLIATFAEGKHEINVTTFIMTILMQFNIQASWTFKELEQQTGINQADLKRCLQSLANGKFRILTKEPKGRDVEITDTFIFNDKFTNKLYRFKISPVSTKKETEEEVQETKQKVDEDRKHQIEAAIVRVMKAKKKLEHNDLIVTVTEQLKSRFVPSPMLIKARIESLIEREYLERFKEDIRFYLYVA
eukprot:TRINITY_DN2153_c0_g1_i1.p1 TRINITY_DN2153_c0_g1~~TRINITY_DN2153_c0_g1_i1.p1  ORF type:complete len:735 (+),score=155.04 TRINITY_DN2153_c0_g1_i1:83-2287(+)